MSARFTQEQIDAYWRDGYVVRARPVRAARPRAVAASTPATSRRARSSRRPAMQMVRDVMVAKKAFAPPTPEHAICKINFFENDPVFMSYARHPALLDCVESLLGPDICCSSTAW